MTTRKTPAVQGEVWRSRIVGHGEVAPAELTANPRNWRKHPLAQREAVTGVLSEIGWVQDVVVNQRTGRLVDGHLRVALALERGEPIVPVVYVDLSEAEEAMVLATLDPIAAMAEADAGALDTLLRDVASESEAIQELLASVAAAAGLYQGPQAGLTDPDDVPEPPAEPVTQPGDLWVLGRHRLLCGDATDRDDVAIVLGGERPALMVTDPPYGVEYDPSWRTTEARKGQLAYGRRRLGAIANDDRADWRDAWALFSGDVVYCWHAGRYASVVQASLEAAGFAIRSQIIWAKSNFPISRGHYHWRHEPAWYAVRAGASAEWIGDRKQTTIWEIGLDKYVEGGHPTQKPVEAMERPLRNHAGDVYDPFIGTGTTIIAAERVGRRCFAIELEPRWVDVAVRRWENYTGGKAVLSAEAH